LKALANGALMEKRLTVDHAARSNPRHPAPPVPFGYKTAWFTIRSEDSEAVARALELGQPQPANWVYGLWQAIETEEYKVFVTPPVVGWVMAVGTPILFEADAYAISRITALSKLFGEAEFFASMRTSSAYTWARAANGRLVRQFYEGDGERREVGDRTEDEKDLTSLFFDPSSPEADDPDYWKRTDLKYLDEEHVLVMAERWSVNPSKLDQMGLPAALGILGTPSSSYPPKPQPLRRKNFFDRLLNR
jgi:hypothetical protein